MAITDYTTTASIRAVLGVSDDELEDTTILDPVYSTLLDEALNDLNPSLATDYATIKAIPSPTPDQKRFLNLISTWSAYTVTQSLLVSVAMFAPQQITAEKDSQVRVSDPYKDLAQSVSELISDLAGRILTLYAKLFPAHVAPVKTVRLNMVSVGLPVDPVTGV